MPAVPCVCMLLNTGGMCLEGKLAILINHSYQTCQLLGEYYRCVCLRSSGVILSLGVSGGGLQHPVFCLVHIT